MPGNQIANIARALGMKVLVAERKGSEASATKTERTPFTETLQQSTVIMLTCPLTDETRGMIDAAEFGLMLPDALLINVARGQLVVDAALVAALENSQIAGASCDVFETEPASRDTSLLVREGPRLKNLILTPHMAWYCSSSIAKVRRLLQENIEAFWAGRPQNLVHYNSIDQEHRV